MVSTGWQTESVDEFWKGMDQWPETCLAERLYEAQLNSLSCFLKGNPEEAIALAGAAIVMRLKGSQGRLIYCGAGSAGAQACVDGLELPGTFGWPRHRLELLLAGGWNSFLNEGSSVEDDTEAALQAVTDLKLTENDVMIAVSASGNTPYTLAAVDKARQSGALVIGVSNNKNSALHKQSDYAIVLETGAEAIAGSTRMAAGTAQKIALNSLSTLVMAKLGYLYDNLMVRLQVGNRKLEGRATKMVMRLCDCEEAVARQWLVEAGYQVPVAVLLQRGLTIDEAQALLSEYHECLRSALDHC